jgi:hypothetical protein
MFMSQKKVDIPIKYIPRGIKGGVVKEDGSG